MKANQTHKRKLYIAQIGALHTFEAAARHGSYSRAAEELVITQAAVSQQLARLRLEGLVSCRRDGKTMHYSIQDPKVATAIGMVYEMFCKPSGAC